MTSSRTPKTDRPQPDVDEPEAADPVRTPADVALTKAFKTIEAQPIPDRLLALVDRLTGRPPRDRRS